MEEDMGKYLFTSVLSTYLITSLQPCTVFCYYYKIVIVGNINDIAFRKYYVYWLHCNWNKCTYYCSRNMNNVHVHVHNMYMYMYIIHISWTMYILCTFTWTYVHLHVHMYMYMTNVHMYNYWNLTLVIKSTYSTCVMSVHTWWVK